MRIKGAVTLGLALLLFCGCAKERVGGRHLTAEELARFSQEHHLERMPPSDVPLVINDRVIAWMEYFQGVGRKHFNRYLERSGRYMDMMQDILKKSGLPKDLIYVALIESGFNTNAYSRAHAVGPWQFIRGTGRRYDLKIDNWEDERRHPVKSTWAAAAYLKDLYREFGDWYLAMAAYNAGEGRIRRAIADSGTKDFWKIAESEEHYIRAETRDYVPKYIAAAIMAKMPQNFGFQDVKYQDPLEFEDATVASQTDIEVIAECAGVGTSEIADLNPHLVRGATPPGSRNYVVHLPKGKVEKFKVAYAKVPEEERIKFVYHRVRRGETLSRIASRYGVSRSSLAAANNMSTRSRLRSGTTLVIPKGAAALAMADYDDGGSTRTKKLVRHKVQRGETLSQIARKYGVSVSQIKSWNHIRKDTALRVGHKLKIYKTVYVAKKSQPRPAPASGSVDNSKVVNHKVSSGETLWSISQRYGVSVEDLVAVNNIESKRRIKIGQKLLIRQPAVVTTAPEQPAEAKEVVVEKEEIKIAMADTNSKLVEHKVAEGDSLWSISQKYGVSVEELVALNGIESAKKIRAGKKIVIRQPKAKVEGKEEVIAMAAAEQSSPDDIDIDKPAASSSKKTAGKGAASSSQYKVQKGDVLGTIAEKHGVTVKELMEWNKIKNPRAVRAGQTLKIKTSGPVKTETKNTAMKLESAKAEPAPKKEVSTAPEKVDQTSEAQPVPDETTGVTQEEPAAAPVPETKKAQPTLTYKVRSGDTLWDIARRHGVSISDIQSWNKLSDPSSVKPGESIIIYKR